MNLSDMSCQHGSKIGTCPSCAAFRQQLAEVAADRRARSSKKFAEWISERATEVGLEQALEEVVARLSRLDSALTGICFGYVDILTMIVNAASLEEAQLACAVGARASKLLSDELVDKTMVDVLDKACQDRGLYEKLGVTDGANRGARGALILVEIR